METIGLWKPLRGKGQGLISLVLLCILAGSCTPYPTQMSLSKLSNLYQTDQMAELYITGTEFTLMAITPKLPDSKTLRVYIEGDGLAWGTRHTLSVHPTPVTPTGLLLMIADPLQDKAYLARPCQYIQTEACHPRYWSSHIFSKEIIQDMDHALDVLKRKGNYNRLELVGFSGGGAVAALLSARRDDIARLITVAGNLDTRAFVKIHGISPMPDSLNPADFATSLSPIPQYHFVGKNDPVIPPEIFKSFIRHIPITKQAPPIIVTGVTHQKGWVRQWPELLQKLEIKPKSL